MSNISLPLLWGFLFCMFPGISALAETVEPTEIISAEESKAYLNDVQQGRQYFEQGDYTQAKRSFERALEKLQPGTKSESSLYYNLGSTCYKLEQYDESSVYFNKLLDDKKFAALANYNLALIENKRNNKAVALHYLKRSKKASTDARFTKLVDRQISQLKGKVRVVKRTRTIKVQDWNAYLYLTTGYDSNINFAPLGVASSDSGYFAQAIGVFDKLIAGGGKKDDAALFVTSSLFMSNYFATDFNDYNLYDIGLRYARPIKRWKNTIDVNLKQSTYGHDKYQRIYSTTLKTRRRFFGGDTLRLSYRYEQIDSLKSIYDYLNGNRQKFRLGYQLRWPKDSIYLWYELEINNRRDTQNLNYSPTRNTARVRYEKKFNATNRVYAEMEYRHSNYEKTAVQNRRDNRPGYQLAYVNDMAPSWQLLARWRFRANRSTEPAFEYDRHVAMLTLRKNF